MRISSSAQVGDETTVRLAARKANTTCMVIFRGLRGGERDAKRHKAMDENPWLARIEPTICETTLVLPQR